MSASERVFVDTNIWLYAFVAGDADKSAKAVEVLRHPSIAISVQIINEVCVNLIRKAHYGEPNVQALIASFYEKCLVTPLEQHLLLKASELRQRYSLSFWDSTIVVAALACQATMLYSEDLQNGLVIENVLRVSNPFLGR